MMRAQQGVQVAQHMRHLNSEALVDFAEIYDESVELISVATPSKAAVSSAAQYLLAQSDLQAQWIQSADGQGDSPGGGRSKLVSEALEVLHADINTPVEVLQELLGCDACGIRLKVLEGPMCPRFHVDKVPCRMLMTYIGKGTEWIAHDDCDLKAMQNPDLAPLLPGCSVRQIEPEAWTLLKGGAWHEGYGGVVHRSPSCRERRLLVSIDPIFSD